MSESTKGLNIKEGLIRITMANPAKIDAVGGLFSTLWYGLLKPLVNKMFPSSIKVLSTSEVVFLKNEDIRSTYASLKGHLSIDPKLDSNGKSRKLLSDSYGVIYDTSVQAQALTKKSYRPNQEQHAKKEFDPSM